MIEALLEHISRSLRMSKQIGTRTDLDMVSEQITDTVGRGKAGHEERRRGENTSASEGGAGGEEERP